MLDGEVTDGRGSSPLHGGAGDLLLPRTAVAKERLFALRQLVYLKRLKYILLKYSSFPVKIVLQNKKLISYYYLKRLHLIITITLSNLLNFLKVILNKKVGLRYNNAVK